MVSKIDVDIEQYEILNLIQSSLSEKKVYLGKKGICRFCGLKRKNKFRTIAHTIPEALGNKWIISNDECDDCNSKFSIVNGGVKVVHCSGGLLPSRAV